MRINSKTYDFIKKYLLTFLGALTVLISTLGTIWGYNTEMITATIGAFVAFFSTLLNVSSKNYWEEVKNTEQAQPMERQD